MKREWDKSGTRMGENGAGVVREWGSCKTSCDGEANDKLDKGSGTGSCAKCYKTYCSDVSYDDVNQAEAVHTNMAPGTTLPRASLDTQLMPFRIHVLVTNLTLQSLTPASQPPSLRRRARSKL